MEIDLSIIKGSKSPYISFWNDNLKFSLYTVRQKALKALNERLQKLEQTTSWPSLDGPEGKDPDSPVSPVNAVDEMPEIVVDQGTTKRSEGVPNSSSVPT